MVYALISDMKVDGKAVAGFQPKNDDYLKIEVEDATPDGGLFMDGGDAITSGRRIKLDHVPQRMTLDGGTFIADYTSYNGFLCVTDKFKAVVESIEPGVHQFIPFEIIGAGKKHIANMWIMVVCNRLDSFDHQQTTMVLYRGVMWMNKNDAPREQWPSHINENTRSRVVFSLSQIGDHHLWYDKHYTDQHPLASDALVAALKEAGVTGVSFSERESV